MYAALLYHPLREVGRKGGREGGRQVGKKEGRKGEMERGKEGRSEGERGKGRRERVIFLTLDATHMLVAEGQGT